MRAIALLLGCAVSVAACSKPERPAAAPAAADAPYSAGIDVIELMVHGMDPAAQAFWDGWGEVYDKDGFHDVSAKTDEEWKRVEDGATTVVLAANTLMLPPYRREPSSEWIRWAKETADQAMLGKEAAEYRDSAAVGEIGIRLYDACKGCHDAFRPE